MLFYFTLVQYEVVAEDFVQISLIMFNTSIFSVLQSLLWGKPFCGGESVKHYSEGRSRELPQMSKQDPTKEQIFLPSSYWVSMKSWQQVDLPTSFLLLFLQQTRKSF